MKIYLAIKFHPDHQNRLLIESIIRHLEKEGHKVVCAVKDFEDWGNTIFAPRELLHKAFTAIDGSDLVLIEATEKGMGVGIEAGYAFAKRIRVMTIAKDGSDLSVNLRSLSERVQLYKDVSEIKV